MNLVVSIVSDLTYESSCFDCFLDLTYESSCFDCFRTSPRNLVVLLLSDLADESSCFDCFRTSPRNLVVFIAFGPHL